MLLTRSFFFLLTNISGYLAIARIKISDYTVILNTHPLLTTLITPLILNEKLEKRILKAILVCFLGVILIIKPESIFGVNT